MEEKNNKFRFNKLLSVAVILGAVIIGVALYGIQLTKQKSIEAQEAQRIAAQKAQQDIENRRADLKVKQDQCESLSSGVKQRWNNILGVTYDDTFWKQCVVTYTDMKTGEVQVSPLNDMQDVK